MKPYVTSRARGISLHPALRGDSRVPAVCRGDSQSCLNPSSPPQETELVGLQMGRQCRHWSVGCLFPHRWHGYLIWHCSWRRRAASHSRRHTLVWAFQEGPERGEREMAITTAPKFKDNMGIRDGCVFKPRKGRPTHTNPARSQSTPWGHTRVPMSARARLWSLPGPQNHVIFITKVLRWKVNPSQFRDKQKHRPLWWWGSWGNYSCTQVTIFLIKL